MPSAYKITICLIFTGVWGDYLKCLVCLWRTGKLSPEILKGEAIPLPHMASPLPSSPPHKGQHGGCQMDGASPRQPAGASLSFIIPTTAIIHVLLRESGSPCIIF